MNKDKRLMEQYQKGNSAQAAFYYFDDWYDKQKEILTNKIMKCPVEEVVGIRNELSSLDKLMKDLKRDIQTGELALKEMEEDNIGTSL